MAYAYSATKTDAAMAQAPSSTPKTDINAALDTMGAALAVLASFVNEIEINEIDDKLTEVADLCGLALGDYTDP